MEEHQPDGCVKLGQLLLCQSRPPQRTQEVHPLLGLLEHGGVALPPHVLVVPRILKECAGDTGQLDVVRGRCNDGVS